MDIKKMSTKNFSVYGKILSSESFAAVPEGEEFSWEDITGDLRLVSPSCTGQLNCRYRDKILYKMESHARTPEIMVALRGDSLLCVAPAGVEKPELEDIECFSVKEGTSFMMNTAVWHWIPYPLQEKGSQFLVLFRDGTGKDDLQFHELNQAITL